MSAAAPPDPGTRRARWAIALACIAAFLVFAGLASRHIDFPLYWHSNTGGQVEEIRRGHHNFRQPLLLVTAASTVVALVPGEQDKQEIAVLGRWVAIVLGGVCVVALALFAGRLRGPMGVFAAAPILAVASPMVHWAHFFKEDTALLAGISLAFLAMAYFWEKRTPLSVAALGAGSGLAVAGKYVGILTTPFALALLLAPAAAPPLRGRGRRLAVFGLGFVAVFVVANYPMLDDIGGFFGGIGYEIGHVGTPFTGKGYLETTPGNFFGRFRGGMESNVALPVQLLALAYLLTLPFRGSRRTAAEWAFVLFGLAFAFVVSQSNLQSSRHFLPVWIWLHCLGALAAAELAWLFASRFRSHPERIAGVVLALLLIATLPSEIGRVLERNADFPNASRVHLRRFVREALPPEARIAATWHAGLPDPHARHQDWPQDWLEQEIRTATDIADSASLRAFVEEGFTHVVSIGGDDRRERLPVPVERLRYEDRVRFYRELAHCELVWNSLDSGAPTSGFNSRHIRVHRLPPASALGPPPPDPVRTLPVEITRGDITPALHHVVLLVFDSLRADRLGSHGNDRPTSPFLDAFAASSVDFADASSAESTSLASAASLATGTEVAQHRVRYRTPWPDTLHARTVARARTLAEILSAAGWSAGAAVRSSGWSAKAGLDAGFTRFGREGATPEGIHQLLSSAPPGRPLFLMLEPGAVGLPYEPPAPFDSMFPGEGPEPKPGRIARGRYDLEHVQRAKAAYDAEVRHADTEARRIIEQLDTAGLERSNTIFVVTALRGEEFRDPHPRDPGGTGNGRTLFGEQIRVPLIVAAPGRAPRVASEPVRLVDVVPTVLELVGIPPASVPGLRGRSLVPALDGEALPLQPVHAGGIHGRGAWIEDGWKYLRYSQRMREAPGSAESQRVAGHFYAEALFDLTADPGETRDLQASEPERLDLLREHYEDYVRALRLPPAFPADAVVAEPVR